MKLAFKLKSEEKGNKNINKKLLYFITFLYAISTGEVAPIELFDIARRIKYSYYSRIMNEIYSLGIGWKYGMANACEIVANKLKSKDLLTSQLSMKFAQILRLGDSISFFLKHEFTVMLKLYTAEYDRHVESMKMLMGIYSAIASTAIFMISASMLMIMISGESNSSTLILVSFTVILGLGSFVYIMYKIFPRDELLDESGGITKKYKILFYVCSVASIAISSILILTNIIDRLLALAIGSIPLICLGFYARRLENHILSMNIWYPTFIRQFGEVYATIGSVGGALRSTLKNDFGPLNKQLHAMLNRIENRVTLEESFELFSKESGNAIITAGNEVVATAITKGSDMTIVGNIISEVTITLNELYNKRIQVAKVFESTLFIMHILSLAVLSFMNSLILLFSNIFDVNTQEIIQLGLIDPELMNSIIPIVVLALSIINGLATKIARGGLYKTAWFNIGMFILIGSIVVYTADIFMDKLLGEIIDLSIDELI
ncbi:MAG: flagellar assembly protein FlaJ [Candidatus Nitrosocaldaceae archaeon]|nr:MAG: flagellar assembly protein FlaJ [Candidatus Nitrosocaldaceae archaeon]